MARQRGWLGALLGLLLACGDRTSAPPPVVHRDPGTPADSSLRRDSAPAAPAAAPLTFRAYRLGGARDLRILADSLGPAAVTTILKLNRIDRAHARAGDTLLLPDGVGPEMSYAPFPDAVGSLDSVPRLIAVSQRVQAFGAYEHGRLVYWGPTSTGKARTPTPSALYFTNWKRKQTISTDNDEWLLKWYFNFENTRGISFHEYELPGYPASHACVRLLAADAEWIYYWARQWRLSKDGRSVEAYGTPVAVFGKYDDKQPRPWRRMAEDPGAARVHPAELDSALTPHLALIRSRIRPDSG